MNNERVLAALGRVVARFPGAKAERAVGVLMPSGLWDADPKHIVAMISFAEPQSFERMSEVQKLVGDELLRDGWTLIP